MSGFSGIQSGDRVTGLPFAGRSEVMAPRGMAATSQPLATQAAVRVLRQGGHAVDAAITANLVLAVVEPMSCGLGGDLFGLVWSASDGELLGLNGSGRSSFEASLDLWRRCCPQGVMPERGPLTVTVPGAVDAWWCLHRRFGRLPWRELFVEAIDYAQTGFPVSDLTTFHWSLFGPKSAEQPGFQKQWLSEGRPPKAGEKVLNRQLARVLKALAERGRDFFYEGEPADRMVRAVGEHGGVLTHSDLRRHRSEWVDPVSADYRGFRVWQLPPNTQGAAVLQMLNLLEGFDISAMGFGSADHLHHWVEAKKLVFEDRARFYADPNFGSWPLAELISKPYAEARRRLISPDRAASAVAAGNPRLDRGDTVCIVVADRDRNMVSMMQSLFLPFGSGVTPDESGFVLQNRGALFSLQPDHANVLEPGKRPFHTIIPSFVTRAGRPYLSFGVMGGGAQPQVETQVLLNLVDFGMGLQEAGDAPRALHEGSSEPTGRAGEGGGTVLLESGFPAPTTQGLMGRGHRLGCTVGLYGGYQAILLDEEQGVYRGASECRQDGQAAGY